MKANILIVIGWRGSKNCYLNMTKEEAIEKYCEADMLDKDLFFESEVPVEVISFDSVFEAYEVWESDYNGLFPALTG